MKKLLKKLFKNGLLLLLSVVGLVWIVPEAHATPSTYIWIPSVDIQPFGVLHIGVDDYYAQHVKSPTDIGYTIGVLPFEKVQAEVGIDLIEPSEDPTFFNFKLGVPEGAFHKWQPAVVVGGFNFGTQYHKDEVRTDFNIGYGLVGKTLPFLGRFSAGYYGGSSTLLTDPRGRRANHGLLFAWDRTLSEISDNLWMAVDYQGGQNDLGALNLGFAYKFAPNFSVIFAADIYNNNSARHIHPTTFTVQFDIDLDMTSMKNFERDIKQIGRIPLNLWETIINLPANTLGVPANSKKVWGEEWKKTKDLFSF